ncbi:hypothetical protein LguiB_009352 [Lonicera macranthoides]
MWSYSQQKSSRLCQNLKPIGVQEGLCLVLLERSLIDPIKIGGRSEFGKDSAFSDWYEEFLLLRKDRDSYEDRNMRCSQKVITSKKVAKNRGGTKGGSFGEFKDWNIVVVCTRERLWDKWKDIQDFINKLYNKNIVFHPFQPDKAVLYCKNMEEAKFFGSLVGTEDIAEESEEEEYVTEIDSYSALDPIGRMCKLFEENGSLSLLNERHNSQEVDRQPSSHSKEITTLFQTFQQSHTTIRGWGQLQVMMASIPT